MKFDLKLPGGGELHFEQEPMSKERFDMIVWSIWIFMVGSGVLEFFRMMSRR